MTNPLHHPFVIAAALLLLAALVFAYTVIWQGATHGVAPLSQTPSSVSQTPSSAQALSPIDESEASIPHFQAGNIDGKITSVIGDAITIAVIVPDPAVTSSLSGVTAQVIVDGDTQMYATNTIKDQAIYKAEVTAYIAAGRTGPSPDPFKHTALTISDLSVGMMINVLPKPGLVQGTTLHALVITPLNLAPTATSTPTPTPPPPSK